MTDKRGIKTMKKTYDIDWSRKSHSRMNIKKTNHGLKVGDVIKITDSNFKSTNAKVYNTEKDNFDVVEV